MQKLLIGNVGPMRGFEPMCFEFHYGKDRQLVDTAI